MIERADTVCIFVGNQDRAMDFYMRILGFELRNDELVYIGAANRRR